VGKKSRDKGSRVERTIVHTLQDSGLAAEKISGMYKSGADISVPVLGVDRDVEVKSRANGCATLYKWLQDRDILIVKADRSTPLVVLRLPLAIEVAKAAERGR
jgi:Holliday junction resolvase